MLIVPERGVPERGVPERRRTKEQIHSDKTHNGTKQRLNPGLLTLHGNQAWQVCAGVCVVHNIP